MALQRLTPSSKCDINTLREYSMATLSANDMTKIASSGDYAGTKRPDIFAAKIKDKKSFRLTSKTGKELVGVEYDKRTETLTYYEKSDAKQTIKTVKRTQIFKDADFGGGSGSGGGAEDTAKTESLQCFYCAYVFNKAKKAVTSVSFANLKSVEQYAKTDVSLDTAYNQGPASWIETDVYIKTANKLWDKFGRRTSGSVYFHRGSGFMNDIYKAKQTCHNRDKESEIPQAPGSFSNDKWNPGDIWMSTLQPTSKPLEKFTNSWGELNGEVLRLAGGGVNGTAKVELLGISLKRIAATQPQATLQEYSTPELMAARKTYTWEGWSFGKTGAFFDSQDIYVRISGKEVQFRTFGGDTSWQGEIKGAAAAGGKIGGGNVNFYCKKIFGKDIYNGKSGKTAESQFLAEINQPSWGYGNKLYEAYKKHNSNSSPMKPLIEKDEFMTRLETQEKNFTNSKIICTNFLDAVMSGTAQQRNAFATELFRYASSDTDQSSYFVKLY